MNTLFGVAIFVALLFLIAFGTALYLVALPFPPIEQPRDVFDFTSMRRLTTEIDPPSLQRYTARDGEELTYRLYESTAERILIFSHGSSYHSGGYHALAVFLSLSGVAKVVLPNLRGHYLSGRHRGDVEYIGQLEDDLSDLIQQLRNQNRNGPITLGGHSSGGGLAIRFAGGAHSKGITSYLLLAPIIPTSPAIKQGTAGGWSNLHFLRLYGLLALNTIGVRGFNALPIVEFNKPPKFWDGTETLTYSYRLNVSYHPRFNYKADLAALGDRVLVLVGANDEAIDAQALRAVFAGAAPQAQVDIVPEISHLGIFTEPATWNAISSWLRELPPSPK